MDFNVKTPKESEERVAEEYLSSLSDLNCNSKPLINMLTMLAEENIEYASVIVKVVEQHISKVSADFKLPVMYLIDSIVKNVKGTYVQLFSQCIVNIFCGVFEMVNEKIRERLYALRQTWNDVFSAQKLYALDVKVKRLDNNWPITAKQPQPSIHVNPDFLKTVSATQAIPTDMEEILHAKTKELLELKKRKLELELEATMKHLEEQEKQLSKATESVITPVEALETASALVPGIQPQTIPSQIVPGMVPSTLMVPQHQLLPDKASGITGSIRHGIFHHNIGNSKPQPEHVLPVGMMSLPPQGYSVISSVGKIKVHPVNPTLLHTVRHRDPRLARQQHFKNISISSTSRMQSGRNILNNTKETNLSEKSVSSYRSKSSLENKGSTRQQSSTSRSSIKGNSNREKDKERKRSETIMVTSSSAGSSILSDRQKSSRPSSRDKQPTLKCDKDAFEIAPLCSALNSNSLTPKNSPTKLKDSKQTSSKSRSCLQSKNLSGSSSPDASNLCKDVDLRKLRASSIQDKRLKLSDSDERADEHKSATKDLDKKNLSTALATATLKNMEVTSNAPLLNQNYNKDDKNFEITVGLDEEKLYPMAADNDNVDNKKRPSTVSGEEEPLLKKMKSSKLDELFGTEDVDLRTATPQQILATQKQAESMILIPPPPPMISQEITCAQHSLENRASYLKTSESSLSEKNLKEAPKKSSSTLDDVRAKLAKTAKYSKIWKIESKKELTDSLKLSELNSNDDSQEANDDKIRTIIAQAQELLETNSINQDQYRNLLQTVMSINETNKLKEAKRRESIRTKQSSHDEENCIEAERMAARDAILKKRIPKLTKDKVKLCDHRTVHLLRSDDNFDGNSAFNPDENDTNTARHVCKGKQNKEKRTKSSKWGDRVDSINHVTSGIKPPQRLWLSGPTNKRGVGFRGTVPHPPLPPLPNPNLRLPQIPWQLCASMRIPPPFVNPMHLVGGNIPPPPQPPIVTLSARPDAAALINKACNSIDNPQENLVRTVNIDGVAKEIRFYDDVAIIFMEVDQPRQIIFKPGQRTIFIDNQEPITLQFNDDYKSVIIDGQSHSVRFGFPSRELFIDEHWYEIYFGGPAVSIPLKKKVHVLKAEGPPPQVNIGSLRRDLVVGKINMIVDAHIIIPLFLDARIQTFFLGLKEHTIQFADNLLTVLLDGIATTVDYGGLPQSLTLGNSKYFIRFGALPQGIVPGKVHIKNMIYIKIEPSESVKDELTSSAPNMEDSVVISSTLTTLQKLNLKLEENKVKLPVTTASLTATDTTSSTSPILPLAPLNNINIDELFQKLVSSGILSSTAQVSRADDRVNSKMTNDVLVSAVQPNLEDSAQETVRAVDLSTQEAIKTRQVSIVSSIYSGMQCSSCGVRFPPELTIKYSQHLDWHFRQNRRERDSSRKAHSRKWYYDIADWGQYEEVEDLEEREKNIFESQQTDLDSIDDVSNQRLSNSPIPTCAAGPEDVDRMCDMCQEKFDQFYNEELEEWHFRSAISLNGKIYHPLCYEDYKASLNPSKSVEGKYELVNKIVNGNDDNAMDIIIKIEGDDKDADAKTSFIIGEEDDDDVIVLPNEEPSITEIVDDEEYVPINITREDIEENKGVIQTIEEYGIKETYELDVEIQEPHIPFTDLDMYEEKKLLDRDDTLSYMNLKIKEEPKDDYDDDDGFEDVGTVLVMPEAPISIPISETPNENIEELHIVAVATPKSIATHQANIELPRVSDKLPKLSEDGNLEPEDEHNLSTTGPTPAIHMASLVNKIKINITKNIVSTNSCSASTTTTMTSTTNNMNIGNSHDLISVSADLHSPGGISAVSNIPVLCGGGTISTIPSSTTSNSNTAPVKDNSIANGSIPSIIDPIVSNISVIGSYGNTLSNSRHRSYIPAATLAGQLMPPIEAAIKYDLKPSLQKVALKKSKKIECGVETSGLCSIM